MASKFFQDIAENHANVRDIPGVVGALEDITKGLTGDKATAKELQLVLRALKSAVLGLTEVVKKQSDDAEASQKKTREVDDELDEYKQKNLKGKFVISWTKGKSSPMKKQNELAAEDPTSLENHIIDLASQKYEVVLSSSDISSCHFLPSGGIFFSLWNLRPGSAFQKLTNQIKSKEQKRDVNIYFNFMLTKRRSELLFEVRKLKKDTKIARFYSDENGVISIKVNEKDQNMKLSSFCETKTSPVMTFQISELHKKVTETRRPQ